MTPNLDFDCSSVNTKATEKLFNLLKDWCGDHLDETVVLGLLIVYLKLDFPIVFFILMSDKTSKISVFYLQLLFLVLPTLITYCSLGSFMQIFVAAQEHLVCV